MHYMVSNQVEEQGIDLISIVLSGPQALKIRNAIQKVAIFFCLKLQE